MTLNKLEEALLFMFDYFEVSSSKPLQIYLKSLEHLDHEWLAKRIHQIILMFIPKYKGHYPSISEIIDPLFNPSETEINNKWNLYCKEFNYGEPSDEFIEIDRFLGKGFRKRYSEILAKDILWLKKEFVELYKDFRKEKVGLLGLAPKNLIEASNTIRIEENNG